MSQNAESRLVAKLKKRIAERLPNAFVVKLADRFTRGLADLLVQAVAPDGCLVVLHVEAKTEKGRQTELQRIMERRIAEQRESVSEGYVDYVVIRSVQELDEYLNTVGL